MLDHFVDSILNLPPDVLGQWGYAIVLISTLVDAIPFLGLAVPGGIMAVASGFFVKLGILNFWQTILILSVAAFIGDTVAYFLGRSFGYKLLVKVGKYVFFKPAHFEKTKKILQAHPRKAIMGGRLHSLTRSIIPFAAGSADVKPSLFIPFAALSTVVWASACVLIGYIFGEGFQIASRYLGGIIFLAFILTVLVVYGYSFVGRFIERNKQTMERYQIYPLLLNIFSIFVVAKISTAVLVGMRVRRLDVVIYHFFQTIQTPVVTEFFMAVTSLATPTNMTIAGLALAIYFIYRRRWYFLALLPVSLFAGVISFSILKKMVQAARPLFPLTLTTDFSFPSGHATLAVIFFGLVAYFFKDSIKSVLWRRIYIIGCALVATIVCVSRLYLNAHWFSDVVAGAAIGIFWVTLFIVFFRFFTNFSPRLMQKELEVELEQEQKLLS